MRAGPDLEGWSLTLRGEVRTSEGVQLLSVKHLELKVVLLSFDLTCPRAAQVVLWEGRGGERREGEGRGEEGKVEKRGERRREG